MMQFVSGNNVGQGSNADGVSVGCAAACGDFGIDVPEQVHRRFAHVGEFFDQVGERSLAEVAVADVIVLFEAGEWSLVAAGDAQGARRLRGLRDALAGSPARVAALPAATFAQASTAYPNSPAARLANDRLTVLAEQGIKPPPPAATSEKPDAG